MRIWGIGCTWSADDMFKVFWDGGYVQIGWSEPEAPGLYAMFGNISIGDMVYIKSLPIGGKNLRIRSIGKAIGYPLNGRIDVEWIKKFDEPIIHPITEGEYRYNVYTNTLYEEFNPGIIKELMALVNGSI